MSTATSRALSVILILLAVLVGWFVYWSEVAPGVSWERFRFSFGLDLQGGTQLLYRADVSGILPDRVSNSVAALRDVIERRVNLFGVSEPVVRTETAGFGEEKEYRLTVELPGVTDVDEAIRLIGQTPFLEFRAPVPEGLEEKFVPTELTGRFLKRASVEFSQQGGFGQATPVVVLDFNEEGAKLFADITSAHVGKPVAVYLDGEPISIPIVQDVITNGKAVISGDFDARAARELAGRLNSGALPVPIELLSTEQVGATLGAPALASGVRAGAYGLATVALFMIFWYRVPGIVAAVSLSMYVLLMLAVFKLIPVTLTSAGIAGFILSIGLAVDANVLIFSRMREELVAGKDVEAAIADGFRRAWPSIRDSNASSISMSVILFWFGTSLIEGFALVFGIGVAMSMFTAILLTRTMLRAIGWNNPSARKLFTSGI